MFSLLDKVIGNLILTGCEMRRRFLDAFSHIPPKNAKE
jgi:hypothetical protein